LALWRYETAGYNHITIDITENTLAACIRATSVGLSSCRLKCYNKMMPLLNLPVLKRSKHLRTAGMSSISSKRSSYYCSLLLAASTSSLSTQIPSFCPTHHHPSFLSSCIACCSFFNIRPPSISPARALPTYHLRAVRAIVTVGSTALALPIALRRAFWVVQRLRSLSSECNQPLGNYSI